MASTLHSAIFKGDHDAVKALIDNEDVNLNDQNAYGQTPLSSAAEMGHEQVVALLLEKDIDLNYQDSSFRTALSWAAEKGHQNVVRLLLEKDHVNPNLHDQYGQSPLTYAADKRHEGVVKLLLERQDINLHSRNITGKTPLSIAAEKRHGNVVKLLLARDGINPNLQDNYGWTPLFCAVEQGHEDVVKLLLDKDNIDPNLQDSNFRTPLLLAAEKRYENMVRLLLEKDDVNPNLQDSNGRTPLSWAAEKGYENVVKLLLEREDVDLNIRDINGRTPLSRAAENRHKKAAWLLLDAGMNTKPKDDSSCTPLSWAAKNGHESVISMLLEDGADPNTQENSRTPLLWAAENGHTGVVELLAQRDSTTLHLLVEKGEFALINLILGINYDVNTKDGLGRTALHIATSYRRLEIATKLISSGADVNAKDISGVTPLRLAILSRHHDLIELLLKSSAFPNGVTVDEWLGVYGEDRSKTLVLLSKRTDGMRLRFIEGPMNRPPVEPDTVKRLFIFPDYATWSQCSGLTKMLKPDEAKFFRSEKIGSPDVEISVAAWTPLGASLENQTWLDGSDWAGCGITWTMTAPTKHNGRSRWKTRDHFSMLPNGWIPDDGADLFHQFIAELTRRWSEVCYMYEDHLSMRRRDQLIKKGQSSDFISRLAEDAKSLAELLSVFRGQVRTARDFAVDYFRRYGECEDPKAMLEIQKFSDIGGRIDRLDQTIRDLLQLEFAWVSINEAYRSTSIAASMKRLSWITFIFLPAMFASSLFGMNVDILQDNPDWRWYILLGGVFLILTVVGWLFFKFVQVERWIEINVESRIKSWASNRPRSGLPT